ncbi:MULTISPECIES: hypothetical protein [Spirosoma]|uniref:Transporter n=1 Tax=Spirosoma liriopis TaxID=2937440 RepID=A0ABT0HGE5_9BACT|nr:MULTISPECIES: hypothetical protein [Spirosoma]MCK8490685.1 hypothetical protein [Spirosoma liriopis]UHG90044.1 hypothetical protein LQ777_17530 [Spirosoma oryzicola]
MRFLPVPVIALVWLCFARPTHAQGLIDGFMRGDRKANLALTYSQETYDSYYINKTETRDPNLGTVTTQALNVYGSFGLGYDLDLIVSAPYIRSESSAGYRQKQEGFQDVSAALRWEAYDYKIGKARLSWLFALGYSMPLQNYVNDDLIAIGRGSRNLDGRTMLHLKAGTFFLTGQYGYIRRGQVTLDRVVNYYEPGQVNPNTSAKINVPDVTELIVRTGIVTKPLYIDVWYQQQTPYKKYIEGTNIAPGIPFPSNAVGFSRVGATVYLKLVGQLGLTAGYGATIDGRNIGKSSRVTGGLVIGRIAR